MRRARLLPMHTLRRRLGLLMAAVAVVGPSCSDGGQSELARVQAEVAARRGTVTTEAAVAPPVTEATTTSSTPTSVATTLARVTTPTSAPAGLGVGARGPEVAALEQRLETLHYWVGAVDDVYDQNTAYAVTAFQKVEGLGRTGRATVEVINALASAKAPPALVPAGGSDRVEIDIPRQVLFLYKGGALQRILPISSGSNQRFCADGWCRRAITPGGTYGFYRQGRGWETGSLGSLYNPVYFNGGIAVHGSKSVPAQPASHGCIRIPMSAAEWFPSEVYIGMPVHVAGVDGQPPTPGVTGTTIPIAAPTTTTTPATTTTTTGLLGGLLTQP